MEFAELTPEEKLVCAIFGEPAWREGVKHFLSDEGQIAVNTLLDEFVAHAKAQGNRFGEATERGVRILRLRFGFEPLTDAERMKHPSRGTRTYDEVKVYFGVTRERIRQIEAKTLRRLRHPAYSRKLKSYLD